MGQHPRLCIISSAATTPPDLATSHQRQIAIPSEIPSPAESYPQCRLLSPVNAIPNANCCGRCRLLSQMQIAMTNAASHLHVEGALQTSSVVEQSSRLWCVACQVTGVDMEDDVVRLRMAEMLVGRMNLKFQDKKTGDIKDEGATKPEVIMRQLCTRPGQAGLRCSQCQPTTLTYHDDNNNNKDNIYN